METNALTETLRTLYNLHAQLNDLLYRLKRGPLILAVHHRKVEQQQTVISEIDQSLAEAKLALGKKQLELDTGEAHIKKRQQQQMETKSNDEYKALGNEIKAKEMAMSVLSDEILEIMDRIEMLEGQLAEAEKTLTVVNDEFNLFKNDLDAKTPALEKRKAEIETTMAVIEDQIPINHMDIYRRSVRDCLRRDGQYNVLAPVQEGYCQHCNTQQVAHRINTLFQGEFVTCCTCGCILFIPSDYRIGNQKK